MKVSIVYSKKRMQALEEEIYEDTPEMKGKTLKAITRALREDNEVSLLNEDESIVNQLRKENPEIDIVFNLSTGLQGESKQSHIPAILERLGIPYTGSGVLAHAVGLSKPKSKEIFMANSIPTPAFQTFTETPLSCELDYPLIVKPVAGGSSRGIKKVESFDELKGAVTETIAEDGKALVEEFIEGKELTMGILGNEHVKVLPILETDFEGLKKDLYDFDIKAKIGYTTDKTFPAILTETQKKRVCKAAVKAYKFIGCRDYARVDIRLHKDTPFVLEINTLPGLYLGYSALPAMAEIDGMSFDTLIKKIFHYAVTHS